MHRDLKPENLFLTQDGLVKILDFGLAKLKHPHDLGTDETQGPAAAAETEPGTILGTVGYMSPEQVRGQAADHRSDIFSLGAVLYEMVSGRRAFRGNSAIDTLGAVLNEDPPELSSSRGPVPPGLEQLVRRCLEKSPDDRLQSAQDLAFALGLLAEHSGYDTAVRLGDGSGGALSPDGRWLLAYSQDRRRLMLWPTGAGEAHTLALHQIESCSDCAWFPDGRSTCSD